jgi:arylsulfate sulfotransferase
MTKTILLCNCTVLALFATPLPAAMSAALTSSVQSPAPLGSVVTWTATVSNANPGTLWYRFRAGYLGQDLRRVVDYGPKPFLDWSAIDREGSYQIEVSVKNRDTGEMADASAIFVLTSLVTNEVPAITPTTNPLVFVYSAPPCGVGGRMKVQFQSPDGFVQSTPYKSCDSVFSMNFYLAGMRSNTQYSAQQTIITGSSASIAGAPILFTTPTISIELPPAVVTTGTIPAVDGILLQSLLSTSSVATDLAGNIVWISPADISMLTRPQPGGTFLGIGEDGTQDESHQFVREFDVAGVTVAETNAARINEQLASMGLHSINAFHHEARKLADGKYLVLANSERILTNVQGPGAVDVIGDTILVLSSDLQVVWAWDSFDHLDPHRMALAGESCTYPAGLGCAPFYLSETAKDWLHGNSLQLTPDGNILYSARHQDWLIKIDYENGAGSGEVLWRLGRGGDFQIVSTDPSPWFSHQHDANFERDNTTLTVFDDGNTRAANDPTAHSRGQVLRIDEQNRGATLVLNADLGTYSPAVGSAQQLRNGNYHFDSGFILDPSGIGGRVSQSLEVDPSGNIMYGIQFGTIEYRSFRMNDLYDATDEVRVKPIPIRSGPGL